jgi:hypothetical protein
MSKGSLEDVSLISKEMYFLREGNFSCRPARMHIKMRPQHAHAGPRILVLYTWQPCAHACLAAHLKLVALKSEFACFCFADIVIALMPFCAACCDHSGACFETLLFLLTRRAPLASNMAGCRTRSTDLEEGQICRPAKRVHHWSVDCALKKSIKCISLFQRLSSRNARGKSRNFGFGTLKSPPPDTRRDA